MIYVYTYTYLSHLNGISVTVSQSVRLRTSNFYFMKETDRMNRTGGDSW